MTPQDAKNEIGRQLHVIERLKAEAKVMAQDLNAQRAEVEAAISILNADQLKASRATAIALLQRIIDHRIAHRKPRGKK